MGVYFDPALDDLQEAVPDWWQGARDPNGELFKWLSAAAGIFDALADQVEQNYADTALSTASFDALLFEWGYVYAILAEEVPLGEAALRAYVQARAAEDGSKESLQRTLLAILQVPPNTTGTILTFDAGGAGLTFPADGSGLLLYGSVDAGAGVLTFPTDGTGLTFGLTFPADPVGWVFVEEFPTFFRVTTKNWLAFDRAAFLRAMKRHRPAHTLTPVLVEVP